MQQKVFLGLINIASLIPELASGFNRLGFESYSVIFNKHQNIVSGNIDLNISELTHEQTELIKKTINEFDPGFESHLYNLMFEWNIHKTLNKSLAECEIFLMVWNSFYHDCSDFEIMKKMNKKIVTYFCGSEIRWKPAIDQEFKKFGMHEVEYDDYYKSHFLEEKLKYLRHAEKYSDIILSIPDQSQLALRPYFSGVVNLIPENYIENSIQRKAPVIIHAPSNAPIKGTRFVKEAFERLQKEGIKFKPILVENVPHQEVLKMYTKSDILVGELLLPGGGKQVFEALASGCVVLSRTAVNQYPNVFPEDYPVIDVTSETIYDELKKIILDYPRRVELAKKGRPYVEKNNDVRKLCAKIIMELENPSDNFDFYPDFFRNHFVPESKEVLDLYNRYTDLVKDCDWYKKNVKPGNRDGLVF